MCEGCWRWSRRRRRCFEMKSSYATHYTLYRTRSTPRVLCSAAHRSVDVRTWPEEQKKKNTGKESKTSELLAWCTGCDKRGRCTHSNTVLHFTAHSSRICKRILYTLYKVYIGYGNNMCKALHKYTHTHTDTHIHFLCADINCSENSEPRGCAEIYRNTVHTVSRGQFGECNSTHMLVLEGSVNCSNLTIIYEYTHIILYLIQYKCNMMYHNFRSPTNRIDVCPETLTLLNGFSTSVITTMA